MSQESLCVLNMAFDQSKFLDQASEFAKEVMPQGVVTQKMLAAMRDHGFELNDELRNSLLEKPKASDNYHFIPQDYTELATIPAWQGLEARQKKKIIHFLWDPSHLHQLSLHDIYQQPDLAEKLYDQVRKLIDQGLIRIKDGDKKITPPLLADAGTVDQQYEFLAVMDAIDMAYCKNRRKVLQWMFFEEISAYFHSPDLLLALARDVSTREFEIYYAERHPGGKKRFAKECCIKSIHRLILKKILPPSSKLSRFLSDHKQGISHDRLCAKYGTQTTEKAWNLYSMLSVISFAKLRKILPVEDARKQLALIKALYTDAQSKQPPEKLVEIAGPDLTKQLAPGQLTLLVQLFREEEILSQARQDGVKKTHPSFVQKVLALLNLSGSKKADLSSASASHLESLVGLLGLETINTLSPGKLQHILAIRDQNFKTALANGFTAYLPKLKMEAILPLAKLFQTPHWEIVKSLRFVNFMDVEILENIAKLSEKGLLDSNFAKFLATVFKQKIKGLRLYHLIEVDMNRDIILFFKEKFLALKEGMVRIAKNNVHLLKQYEPLAQLFFKKTSEQLQSFFEDSYRLGKFISELNTGSRRKIVVEPQ